MGEKWSCQQLADHWGMEYNAVRHLAWRGKIPGCTREGRSYVFDKDVVLAKWIPPRVASWVARVRTPSLDGLKTVQQAAERYLETLVSAIPAEDWVAVVLKALSQAKEGDWRARQWLGNYLMGTPVQRVVAEVDMNTRRDFAESERAAAVVALLQNVREREEAEVIDVVSTPVAETVDANRETPSGRAAEQYTTMDASPRERSADSGIRE